jgi:drug/metabolite transporter (DMT)-like permease
MALRIQRLDNTVDCLWWSQWLGYAQRPSRRGSSYLILEELPFHPIHCKRTFFPPHNSFLEQNLTKTPSETNHQPSVSIYLQRWLLILLRCINVSIAAGLLFGAIYHLCSTNRDANLGLIAVVTIVFGCCVGLVTNARKSKVFAACAAYCAVLVVFTSENLTFKQWELFE